MIEAMNLTEYEIELLRAGVRDGKAATFTCSIPSMAAKLKGLDLIEDFDKFDPPDWVVKLEPLAARRTDVLQLTATGASAIGAKCEACGEGDPFRVGPTGSLARLTIYCRACSDRWESQGREMLAHFDAERRSERERQNCSWWRRLLQRCHLGVCA